jgi:hypothetical protein
MKGNNVNEVGYEVEGEMEKDEGQREKNRGILC